MEGSRGSRARYLLETLAVALLGPAVFLCASRGLVLLGMPRPVRLWAEPETWLPGMVPPFPWVDCLSYLLGLVAVPLLWERATRRDHWQALGLRRPGGPRPALTLTLAITGLLVYQRLVLRCLGQRPPSLLAPENLAYFLGLWACVAVSEELFFRSILQRRLSRLWGDAAAIVLVAALFAFALHHRAPVIENAVIRLPFALVLGWLFARQSSLLSPVLAHFALNLSALA